MNTRKRWLESVLKSAEKPAPPMPWARGARREAMIERREETQEPDVRSA